MRSMTLTGLLLLAACSKPSAVNAAANEVLAD